MHPIQYKIPEVQAQGGSTLHLSLPSFRSTWPWIFPAKSHPISILTFLCFSFSAGPKLIHYVLHLMCWTNYRVDHFFSVQSILETALNSIGVCLIMVDTIMFPAHVLKALSPWPNYCLLHLRQQWTIWIHMATKHLWQEGKQVYRDNPWFLQCCSGTNHIEIKHHLAPQEL